jgi:uncharacterized protein YneF (UPF0154 family)
MKRNNELKLEIIVICFLIGFILGIFYFVLSF